MDRQMVRRLVLTLLAWPVLATAAWSIHIHGYTAARNDRFSSGYPAAPMPNANLLSGTAIPYSTFDYSGLGWSTATDPYTGVTYPAATLITPQHVLSARHFPPGVGAMPTDVQFRGGDGAMHVYQINSWTPLLYAGQQSDLYLGTLSSPIAGGDLVNPFPIISTGAFSSPFTSVQPVDAPLFDFYLGREVLVVGRTTNTQGAAFGRNRVTAFADIDLYDNSIIDNIATIYEYDPFGPGGFNPDEAYLTSGDSGAALLMEVNGQLALLGTHMSVDETNTFNFDTFVPFYIPQINQALQLQGSAFQVSVIGVPEPGTLLLLTAGAGIMIGMSRWRRQMCPKLLAADERIDLQPRSRW